jgi:hypothetical protein
MFSIRLAKKDGFGKKRRFLFAPWWIFIKKEACNRHASFL